MKTGDKVRLKAGGQEMTLFTFRGQTAFAKWARPDGSETGEWFVLSELKVVEEPQASTEPPA